ncbi:FecR family protein [Mucilaginibacter lappiensis]|uniref:Ferric-dicitrate binding protein FerR (Iron transport regulator) n=1 Tax=Mucilaginibacter lappiensis TaxID=354630 RepID=A0A1N6PQD9_9SPHI|nr:FecR family protein [Mucilaginibacter lappiensis]MBB6107502.1 ferric-dicitrate binding protein FerR (iron transport regulator) [Mucilaginibacter lappiensis]MBB6126179.1 ferric-dicitrate binding protein FerR (iron transport regulator) [Mucilaginibacter lappiensis]SIQ06402.1 FecR family protein [Mucilaginibacter lappiensis]
MTLWRRPDPGDKVGEEHLRDEEAMHAVEKEMLRNIHKDILGRWHFFKTTTARYTIAASLLLMCCCGLLYKKLSANDEANWIAVSSPKGNIKNIQLPDGSTVWLNSGSILKFPEHFGKTREIELVDGEAYFDVKHDDHSPFTVHYGRLHARVLGTAFNVKFYKNISDVRLSVTRGRVEVGNKSSSFGVITLGKEVVYDQKAGTHQIRLIDAEKVSAWKSNEINLYSIPFDELVMRLENIYNVHINYDHTRVNHLTTTIHFSRVNTLPYVLNIIKTIHHLDYDINGKEIYLRKM